MKPMSPKELASLLKKRADQKQCLTEEEHFALSDMVFAHVYYGLYLDDDAKIMEDLRKYNVVAEIFGRCEAAKKDFESKTPEKIREEAEESLRGIYEKLASKQH